jgi:RNA polymerase sigma-70 factor (ECF subfamily)
LVLVREFLQILTFFTRICPAVATITEHQGRWRSTMQHPPSTDAPMPGPEAGPIDWPSALQRHRGWLRTVIGCRTGDSQAVDDVLQELAVAVLTQDARPTDPEKVAPWLFRVAVRQAILHRRRSGRRKRLLDAVGQARLDSESGGDPQDWVLQKEARQAVASALAQLPQPDREILLLKYTEDWSYRQLADHLGVGTNTVEYRLLRAKKRLRAQLTERNRGEK